MVKIDFLKDYTFTFFDVETTGLDPHYGDRICEVALLKCRNGKTIKTFQSLINPQRPISSGAFAVNGISQKMLKGKPLFKEVAPKILSIMKDSILICHNVPFDLGFLMAECNRERFEIPECPVIDTLALARSSFRFFSNSLGNIAGDLGIEVSDAHRAMADVETTMKVFARFMADFETRGVDNLEEIFSLQASRSYRRSKNNFVVPPHLEEAVENKRPMKIKYVSAMGMHSIRIVEPKEIVSGYDCLYLVAHCHLRNAERNFRLDRIIEMSFLENMHDQSEVNSNMGYEELIRAIFKDKIIDIADINSIRQTIDEFMEGLTERQRIILQMHFGLLDGKRKTLQQIGDIFGITRERIRQLQRKILRSLKHPARSTKLREYVILSEEDKDG